MKATVVDLLSPATTIVTINSPDEFKGAELKLYNKRLNIDKPKLGDTVTINVEVNDEGVPQEVLTIDVDSAVSEMPRLIEDEKPEVAEYIKSTDSYYISPKHLNLINTVMGILKSDGIATLLLLGPSGWGKTLMGEQIAKQMSMLLTWKNMADITEAEEIYGTREFDGKTEFRLHNYIYDIMAGDCIVTLDEVTRVEQQKLGPLFPLMDYRRHTEILNQEVRVGRNVLFIMTANQGHQYTGTEAIDEAFSNRANAILRLNSIPEAEEAKVLTNNEGIDPKMAKDIANFMVFLRGYQEELDASLRMSSYIAKLMKHGATMMEAVQGLVFERDSVSDKSSKEIYDAIKSRES